MGYDIDELKFIGMIHTLAEDEFNASVTEDELEKFVKGLYQEYVAAGKPRQQRQWLRDRLSSCFPSVAKPPNWVGTGAPWPFFDGKPMVFIDQVEVPPGEVTDKAAAPGAVLYVFGARRPLTDIPDSFEMVYKVVEKFADL